MRTYTEWLTEPEGEPEQDNLLLGGLPDQDDELVPPDEVQAICSGFQGDSDD